MKIIRYLSSIPSAAQGGAVAIGNFDGLHRGHRFLLEKAKRAGRPFTVLSFEPHPRRFFAPDLPPFRLTPFAEKAELLRDLGVDYFLCLRFNAALSRLTAQEFAERIVVTGLRAKSVFVGSDFVFGHKRGGNIETLRQMAARGGFTVEGVDLLTDETGEAVSSSRIREFLQQAKPQEAAKLLGRNFVFLGHVRHRRKLGRQLGFPTANMLLHDYQHPAYGVYAVKVRVGEKLYSGVANIGVRPTLGGEQEAQIEAHIFDFDGDLYGRKIAVELISFLRPEKKFAGLDELKAQIARDAEEARKILRAK